MADWDEDSPILCANLTRLLNFIRDDARARKPLSVEDARMWQVETMRNLVPAREIYIGRFRGEKGLEDTGVRIGPYSGVAPWEVKKALGAFEKSLHEMLADFDKSFSVGATVTQENLLDILEFCAWVHAEWVRIHPFANGNGRTARLWANAIAMRYGLPPFVRLRPRPGDGYTQAAKAAMIGDWEASVPVFWKC